MATDNLHHIANLCVEVCEPNAESLAIRNAQPNAGSGPGTGDEKW